MTSKTDLAKIYAAANKQERIPCVRRILLLPTFFTYDKFKKKASSQMPAASNFFPYLT